jgi:hypothetical protein
VGSSNSSSFGWIASACDRHPLQLSGKPEELWNNDHVRAAYLGGLAAAS